MNKPSYPSTAVFLNLGGVNKFPGECETFSAVPRWKFDQ